MDLKPEGFVHAVRKLVQTLRYGPREFSLATIGLLLFALASAAPAEGGEPLKQALPWIRLAGLLFLALAAWLIWRKVVAPVPEGKPKPPAIKGPAPFGPHDAELFARLGRKDDLDRLRAWILDDQKPIVALVGQSGVGKTSLLRAGLEGHLKGDDVQVIYWEALPTDPEEGLLHSIQSRWGDPTTAPATFAELGSAVAQGKRVVVIDQAEQLSPVRHRGIFDLLRHLATANPPYKATWVVAFRYEYLSDWRIFELGLPEYVQRRLETLYLHRFSPERAEQVIAVLAEEGGLSIEQKVVKVLVESIEVEGEVTPADIGISLLVLSELSSDNKTSAFTVEDFRARGGQTGLLERYLERLLEENFPEAERREIFRVLLSLIDLDSDQRMPEGRTPLELEDTARPASSTRFAAVLRFLASGKARILEEVPEPPLRYRLTHERLIPAIRRLTGVLLAEVEQADRLLERAYRIWNRDRKTRYLLSGQELRQVLRFRSQLSQLSWGREADQKREYLSLASRHRAKLRACMALIIAAIGACSYLYSNYHSRIATERALLAEWGLPPNLVDHLPQLEKLALPDVVTRYDWLRRAHKLRTLDIARNNQIDLQELPAGLRTLKLRSSLEEGTIEDISSKLTQLPNGITSLEIEEEINPAKLPNSLLSLSIRCYVSSLKHFRFPESLRSLHINLAEQPDLGDDEKYDLEDLDLRYLKNLRSIQLRNDIASGHITFRKLKLPEGLQNAHFEYVEMENWKELPSSLELLKTTYSLRHEQLPESVKRLALWHPGGEDGLPIIGMPPTVMMKIPPLYSMSTLEYTLPPGPLEGLEELAIIKYGSWKNILELLPSSLKRLKLEMDPDDHDNPRNLKFHDGLVSLETVGIDAKFAGPLPSGLTTLVFDASQTSLPKLPNSLTSLAYYGPLREPLPASIRSLSIRASDQELPFLELRALIRLELQGSATRIPSSLVSLESLDISSSEVRELLGLPPNLTSLALRPGQIDSLDGMPSGVVSLSFTEVVSEH